MEAIAQGYARGVAAQQDTATQDSTPRDPVCSCTAKLMLFSGEGLRSYLGCLNCSQYASDSVFNQFGTHGSQYSAESVFNSYGQFGSRYSNESACNPYATDPPVIVDEGGNFYGRLTVNTYHLQATRNQTFLAWIAGVCHD